MSNLKSSGASFASDALKGINEEKSKMQMGDISPEAAAFESLTSSMSTTNALRYEKPTMMDSMSVPRLGINLSDAEMCMNGCNGGNDKRYRLLLSTTDKIHFHLYVTEYTDFDHPSFQNRFIKLLRTLNENTTLNIHLGNGIYGNYPIFSFGNIIDALQRTNCKVIIHCNGRAGFAESVLWAFGHERVISEFGSLYFTGMQQWFEWYPRWYNFYKFIYDHLVAINVLTQSEMDQLMTTNIDIPLLQREILTRLAAGAPPDQPSTNDPLPAPEVNSPVTAE